MAKKRKKKVTIRKRKFSLTLALIFVVAMVGYLGYRIYTSHAAGVFSGHVKDQYGRGAAGFIIYDCNGRTARTDSNGYFAISGLNQFDGMCVAVGGPYPKDYSNPRAIRNNIGINDKDYNYQKYQAYCPGNPNPICGGYPYFYDLAYGNGTDVNVYDFTATYTDRTPPSAPRLNAAVAGTSQINLSWSASVDVAPGYNGIAGYDIYRNGAKIASTGSTSYAVGGLAAGTTYSFYVRARDGSQNQSAASNTVSATTNRPSGGGGGGGGNTGGGGGTVKPRPSGSTSSGGTTTQQGSGGTLSAPSNLTANTNVVGVVLNWSLSSGGTGDISYQIDRSTNGTDWQSVSSSVFGSSYADTTASYNTSYTYRVRASDSTGAVSDYVTATVTTGSYSATQGNTISSDDGNVTATIADGAVDKDSACAIVNQSETQPVSNPSTPIVQGPYLLICRNANGDVINEFKGNVDIAIKLTSETLSGHGNFQVTEIQPDSTDWQNVESKYNSRDKTVTFTTTKASTFAVTAKKQANIVRYVLIGLLVAGIGFVIFMLIKRKDTIVEWFYRH